MPYRYFHAPNGDRFWRALGFQLGYFPNGRQPLFSERYGLRKIRRLRLQLGRREIIIVRLRRCP